MERIPSSSSSQAPASSTAVAAGRKRPLAVGQPERSSSKRRRLGQASVLCMRELFRAAVKDGDISDVDRLVLQNVAVLLSQVDGNTWVSFADTQGSLQELAAPQVKRLRPFLENVARDLREQEVQLSSLDSNNQEVLDCLQLAAVPWADGITASELLSCCEPERELIFSGLLARATALLPTQYMFRSRVRELLNHYYLRHYDGSPAGRSFLEWLEDSRIPILSSVVVPCIRTLMQAAVSVARASVAPLRWVVRTFASISRTASGSVASAVVAAMASAVNAVGPRLLDVLPVRILRSQEPVWPALRFFFAAFLHGQLRKLFKVLVLITSWRVILCLAACSETLGWLLHPVVWLAARVLNWSPSSRFWGCACLDSDDPSLLSWVPVRASHTLVELLGLVRLLPLSGPVVQSCLEAAEFARPMLSFLCDLTFSIGLARGLALVVDIADESAQQKLVWMSMNIARIIREGPSLEDYVRAPVPPVALREVPQSQRDELPVQAVWNEEGTWSVFDS